LSEAHEAIEALCSSQEHIFIEDIPTQSGGLIRHLSVCGRKAPYTSSLKNAHAIYSKLFDEYGKRALAAEKNEGIDWKALSHAVRIGRQSIELLETAHITFPRPDAAHLIAIKTGQLEYQPVAEEIEELLEKIEVAAQRSALPDEPNYQWINNFVIGEYHNSVHRTFC
jgi:hypothetical protein